MQYTTTESGLEIVYQRSGNGQPLVLLHGFICDGRVWRRQVDDLSRYFDVIVWDAPGCGESSDPPETFTMGEFADCLAGLMDHAGVTSAHMLGISWGGTLALEFYRTRAARVRSLILADTYAGWTGSLGQEQAQQRLARCLRESEMPADAWVPQWVPDAFSGAAPPALLDEYASVMREFHPVGFRSMSRAVTPDFSDILPQIDVPTLLIWGADDKRSPLSVGQAMCDGINGAGLVVIPGGHVSNMEHPERFNIAVREFILGLDDKPRMSTR